MRLWRCLRSGDSLSLDLGAAALAGGLAMWLDQGRFARWTQYREAVLVAQGQMT